MLNEWRCHKPLTISMRVHTLQDTLYSTMGGMACYRCGAELGRMPRGKDIAQVELRVKADI